MIRNRAMRKIPVLLWILVPVAVVALHFGPGQRFDARDRAGEMLMGARSAAADEKWDDAVGLFGKAHEILSQESPTIRHRVALERARAMIHKGELPEGMGELSTILDEMTSTGEPEVDLVREVRSELASASYYAGWLLRLEGADTEEWMRETEVARRQFRLLAEQPDKDDPAGRDVFRKNLEATVRLQRMDLSELQGLPLPKKCKNCKGIGKRRRRQRQQRQRGNKQGDKEPEEDIRKQLKKEKGGDGAGLNKRAEGFGS